MNDSAAKAALEHRILARSYREMAESWRTVLIDPEEAARCVAEAEYHEHEASRLERMALARPIPTPAP